MEDAWEGFHVDEQANKITFVLLMGQAQYNYLRQTKQKTGI